MFQDLNDKQLCGLLFSSISYRLITNLYQFETWCVNCVFLWICAGENNYIKLRPEQILAHWSLGEIYSYKSAAESRRWQIHGANSSPKSCGWARLKAEAGLSHEACSGVPKYTLMLKSSLITVISIDQPKQLISGVDNAVRITVDWAAVPCELNVNSSYMSY